MELTAFVAVVVGTVAIVGVCGLVIERSSKRFLADWQERYEPTEGHEMVISRCGRYWSDVWHEPIAGWCVRFRPVAFDAITEERWGFRQPHEAARCIELLVSEHFDVVEEAA